MADRNIKITFEIDGISQTVNSIEEFNDAVKKSNKSVKEAEKQQGFFSKKVDEAKEKLQGFKSSLGEIGGGFTKLSGGLSKIAKGFGLSGRAAQVFGKVTAGAIAATGIGLLIVAVGSLINYFTNLEGGVKVLRKAMAGLGAIVTNISKAFSLVVQGKFSEAFDTLKNSVVEATEAVDKQFEAENKLSELRQKNIIENAKLNQEIEKQKKILEDGTLATEERLAALDKVNAATRQLMQNTIDETKLALDQAQAELVNITNYKERQEAQEAIAQLQADLIDQTTQLQNVEYDAAKVAREIRQQEADEKAAQAEKEEQERLKKKEQEEKDAADRKAARDKELEEEKKRSEEAAKAAKEEADKKKAYEEAVQKTKVDLANQGLAIIGELAGEGSAIAKGAAIASATINTYQAATNALANTPGPPPIPQIAAGLTYASGLLQVKNILATKTPGDSKGNVAAPSVRPPAGRTFDPSQITNVGQGQNAGETLTLGTSRNQPVVKAYVVATEVSSAQEANKKIDDLARL